MTKRRCCLARDSNSAVPLHLAANVEPRWTALSSSSSSSVANVNRRSIGIVSLFVWSPPTLHVTIFFAAATFFSSSLNKELVLFSLSLALLLSLPVVKTLLLSSSSLLLRDAEEFEQSTFLLFWLFARVSAPFFSFVVFFSFLLSFL